jgi:hypothetical protein
LTTGRRVSNFDTVAAKTLAKALEAASPSLDEVAHWIGVSYSTLRSYRARVRQAPPETMERLAVALRKRARLLDKMADEVMRSSKD